MDHLRFCCFLLFYMELYEFNREWRAELIFKHAYADFSFPYLDFKHLQKHKRGRKPTCNCEHKACARVQLCHLLPPGHLFLRENMILSGVKTLPLVTFTAALPLDSLLPHQPIYFYAPWFSRPGAGYSDNRDVVHPDTCGWSHTVSHNLGGKPQMSAMFSFIWIWVSVCHCSHCYNEVPLLCECHQETDDFYWLCNEHSSVIIWMQLFMRLLVNHE